MFIACDLFCGGGGSAMGLSQAGFTHIDGFDIKEQPDYPFEMFVEDAMNVDLEPYDFIWASPPCQAYSIGTRNDNRDKHPDLLEPVRQKLIDSGKPYIIENVVGAKLLNPIVLCGTMFPGLKVFRHRLFESNLPLVVDMKCDHKGHKAKERRPDKGDFFTVAGHNTGTMQEWEDAMNIHWLSKKTVLAQAIPPAYSKYLGEQVIKCLLSINGDALVL
jgi:DNA (cytosine-5)-methyltransferase 1